jgi:hypothetical protein
MLRLLKCRIALTGSGFRGYAIGSEMANGQIKLFDSANSRRL